MRSVPPRRRSMRLRVQLGARTDHAADPDIGVRTRPGLRYTQFRKGNNRKVFRETLLSQQVPETPVDRVCIFTGILLSGDSALEPGRKQKSQPFDGLAEILQATTGVMPILVGIVDADPETQSDAATRAGDAR